MTVVNPAEMAKAAMDLVRKPSEIVTLNSMSGPCVIFGAHLVHAKLIGIIGQLLNLPEWADGKHPGPGINSIVLRGDGLPRKESGVSVFGSATHDAGAVAINLRRIWEKSIETAITEEPTLSLRATLWHELIVTLAHEVHHAAVASQLAFSSSGPWTEEDYNAEEASAKEWALEKVMEFATTPETCEIEPPPFSEEPFFGFLFMKANVERQKDEHAGEWDNQILMLTNNWAWHDPADGMTCKTWADWVLSETQSGEKISIPADETQTDVEKLALKMISKDTGEEPVVETADENAIVPINSAVTKKESTFKHESPATVSETVEPVDDSEVGPEGRTVTLDSLFPGHPNFVDMTKDADTTMNTDLFGSSTVTPEEMDSDTMSLIMDDGEATGTIAEDLPPNVATESVEQPVYTQPTPQAQVKQTFDPLAVSNTVQLLFKRLFTHIFTKCGFVRGSFTNPTAIFEPIPITDIPGIEILVGMDTINEHGQFKKKTPIAGFVKGQIFQKSKLPAYHIYLNIGGVVHERRIIPQNPTTGTVPALEALEGNHRGYIMDAKERDRNKAFKFWYTNGELSPCIPR